MVARNINSQILIKWNYIEIFVNHFHLCSMNFRNLIIWDAQLLLFVQHKFSLSFDRDAVNSLRRSHRFFFLCRFLCQKKETRNGVDFSFRPKEYWIEKESKKRRNEIGSKSDIIIGARISKILLDYIFDSWFVILKRFKLTVNEFTVLKEFRLRMLRWLVLLIESYFSDYLQISRRCIVLVRQVNWSYFFSLLFLMF